MEGCLRNLEINNRMYSFKSSQHGQGGDALEGRNVEESDDKLSLEDKDDSCHDPNNLCENGGICITPYVESEAADQTSCMLIGKKSENYHLKPMYLLFFLMNYFWQMITEYARRIKLIKKYYSESIDVSIRITH